MSALRKNDDPVLVFNESVLSRMTMPDSRLGRGVRDLSGSVVFTTGAVARLLAVAPRTVSKWCDAGVLRSYRLPMSEDRRILREDLVRFLRDHQIPAPDHLKLANSVVIASRNHTLVGELQSRLEVGGWEVLPARNMFQLGRLVNDSVACFVIDLALGTSECLDAAECLRRKVFLMGEDWGGSTIWTPEAAPDAVVVHPHQAEAVARVAAGVARTAFKPRHRARVKGDNHATE